MQARLAFLSAAMLTACLAGAMTQARAAALPSGGETILDTGQATWYGGRHQGLRTFSGERFDTRKMTAAHSSLPMGTMVRVTDVASGRSIIVRVNDREPPHGVRCIDLSEGAALALGIHSRGVAEVTITAVAAASATLPADPAPVEVAEAPDASGAAGAVVHRSRPSVRHGRQHRHRAGR